MLNIKDNFLLGAKVQFFAIKDIGDINFNSLIKDLPGRPSWNPFSTQGQYVSAILKSYGTMKKYDINTALRLAHFLGQGLIETGFLRYKAENLNYSADGLLKIFPKYFTPEQARSYARKPEKIANRVYANRMGNGDEASGDGWRYRGRGFFQLTGKNNYGRYGEMAGIDLVGNPEILEKDLTTSVKVAAAFFSKTGLTEFADRNDAAGVSRGVNRGNPNSRYKAHGEAERLVWTQKVLNVVKNPQKLVASGVSAAAPSIAAGLNLGDRGEIVKAIQEKLALLGFPVGAPDGVFGKNTRRAVLAFQDEYGVDMTGIVDTETAEALDDALEDTRSMQSAEREAAGEDDLKRAGAKDIGKTNQVGAAGATSVGAGAIAAANEVGLVEPVVEAITDAISPDADEAAATTDEEIADEETTGETTATDDAPDLGEDAPTEQETTPDPVAEDVPAPTETTVPATPPETEMPDSDAEAAEVDAPVETVEATPQTTTSTEQPIPESAATETETDWVLMGVLGAVVLIGAFIWLRSRNIVEDRVEDYRDGRYI